MNPLLPLLALALHQPQPPRSFRAFRPTLGSSLPLHPNPTPPAPPEKKKKGLEKFQALLAESIAARQAAEAAGVALTGRLATLNAEKEAMGGAATRAVEEIKEANEEIVRVEKKMADYRIKRDKERYDAYNQ